GGDPGGRARRPPRPRTVAGAAGIRLPPLHFPRRRAAAGPRGGRTEAPAAGLRIRRSGGGYRPRSTPVTAGGYRGRRTPGTLNTGAGQRPTAGTSHPTPGTSAPGLRLHAPRDAPGRGPLGRVQVTRPAHRGSDDAR